MLRSYDPQIGRFLQHDPYDQFASGYVGMGGDPGNNVDPTGGAVPGIGCAASAGMSGYGGFAGRIAGGFSMGGGVLSSALTMSGIAVNGANITNGLSNLGNSNFSSRGEGLSQFSSGGASGPNAELEGDDRGYSGSDCNCPKGYGPKPKPGGDPRPYFESGLVDAAIAWAFEHGSKAVEFSSVLFRIDVQNKSGNPTSLFSYSTPIRLHGEDALYGSPSVEDARHKKEGNLPAGFIIIGHIHLHWPGSQRKHHSNVGFSFNDENDHSRYSNIVNKYHLFVLGSTGNLFIRYKNPYFASDDIEKRDNIGGSKPPIGKVRANQDKDIELLSFPNCPCYKQ